MITMLEVMIFINLVVVAALSFSIYKFLTRIKYQQDTFIKTFNKVKEERKKSSKVEEIRKPRIVAHSEEYLARLEEKNDKL
jgi:predicted Holliday junction resolvase-like endonuclease